MWRTAAIVFLACVLGLPAVAHDSEPINTNFAAPFVRGSGSFQCGLQAFADLPLYNLVPVELEYGFAPRQQFALGIPLVRLDSGSGTYYRPGNVEVEYRLLIAGENRRRFA